MIEATFQRLECAKDQTSRLHRREHPMTPLPITINKLTSTQERAVLALMTEQTPVKAAEVAGVSLRTLYRWMKEPAFIEAYRMARRDAFSQAIALTQRYAALAVNTLARAMTDNSTTGSSKIAAAVALLRFGREGIELEDLAARVDALEVLNRGEMARGPRAALPNHR